MHQPHPSHCMPVQKGGMMCLLSAWSHAGASSFTEHMGWFAALSGIGLVTSFSSTLMFTALGSFFNRISDPGEPSGSCSAMAMP